ncbi:helix-turn-helix domain-containing protein [Brevibacillus parabrevis]|mgnify:CR=1 FL=1|jgi:Predicted transcriptional regulators|uniref:helix-turn-helix domain-containing protein n=1 Tax=Brevibacillus parabrevis TaxID=54914 RepID=UPI00248F9AB7|nr:helix-turn-helix transcriptional regulator [Brevibacillus parabrevis]
MDDLLQKLGERLRFLRKHKGWSQDYLAEQAGLHTNYIGQIERGEKNLTIETLYKVTSGLGTSLEELFQSIDPKVRQTGLSSIIELLSQRPEEDQAMALHLIQTVFQWNDRHTK